MTHKGLHILQIQAILCSPLLPHSLPFPTQLPPGQAWTSQNPMPVHLSISLSEMPSLPLPWLRNFILQELIQRSPSRKPNPLRHNSLCSSLGSPLLSLPNLQYPLVPVWGLHTISACHGHSCTWIHHWGTHVSDSTTWILLGCFQGHIWELPFSNFTKA